MSTEDYNVHSFDPWYVCSDSAFPGDMQTPKVLTILSGTQPSQDHYKAYAFTRKRNRYSFRDSNAWVPDTVVAYTVRADYAGLILQATIIENADGIANVVTIEHSVKMMMTHVQQAAHIFNQAAKKKPFNYSIEVKSSLINFSSSTLGSGGNSADKALSDLDARIDTQRSLPFTTQPIDRKVAELLWENRNKSSQRLVPPRSEIEQLLDTFPPEFQNVFPPNVFGSTGRSYAASGSSPGFSDPLAAFAANHGVPRSAFASRGHQPRYTFGNPAGPSTYGSQQQPPPAYDFTDGTQDDDTKGKGTKGPSDTKDKDDFFDGSSW